MKVLTYVTLTALVAMVPSVTQTLRAQVPSASLEGTAWTAVELYGTPVPSQSSGREPHIVFGIGGRMSGADGCNLLTGPYTLNSNGISFGAIVGTQMLCPNTDEIANRFRNALRGTSHWSFVGNRLELYGATGKPLAVLARRQTPGAANTPPAPSPSLEGTAWQLVRFQGGDDRVRTPDDPAKYTVEFLTGGALAVRFDCNRGRGTWKTDGAAGLTLGPLALTRARCPDGSLHDQMAAQWGAIRAFAIRNGNLFLSLMADGGVYEFSPLVRRQP